MPVSHHRDLEVWRLAHQVRELVFGLVSKPSVRDDHDFCRQSVRAARSACRNLCEGFYRFSHPEFANYVNIARGSLGELLDSVAEARLAHYASTEECDALADRIEHAIAAASSLHRFLSENPTPPRPASQTRRRRPPR